MNVRAKFVCRSINERKDCNGYEIKLEPVVGGSEENDKFFNYTPWGSLEMGVVSGETAKLFTVGSEYYLDISHALKPE